MGLLFHTIYLRKVFLTFFFLIYDMQKLTLATLFSDKFPKELFTNKIKQSEQLIYKTKQSERVKSADT